MNVWRWLGISIFLACTVGLISTTNLSVLEAVAQDKKVEEKKKEETKKEETKKEEKKKEEAKKEETKKEEPKVEAKKEETKKEEPKKEEAKIPAKGTIAFTAFKKGAPKSYQLQKTTTKQEMKVMGQVVTQTQDQTFLIEWAPLDEVKDSYVVAQKIVGVKMEINIGGNKIAYDSTSSAKQKNPMTDFFEQLTKQELKFTIKSDLSKVESIDGREKFIQSLQEINPQMKGLLNAILSDKALTKMAEPTWFAFPAGGSFDKQTWTRKSDLDLGPIGKYETTFEFTYKGLKDNKDEIGIKTKMTYSAPTEKAGLPFIIHEAKLTANDGEGSTTFDRAKGRFDKTELKMTLKGTLKIEVGNMTTQVELDQTQTSSSTTLDAIPDDWKSKQ